MSSTHANVMISKPSDRDQVATVARKHFPSLCLTDPATVFFDNPGGTQVPEQVMNQMTQYLLHSNANIHGSFSTSKRTDAVLEKAHHGMERLLSAAPQEVHFGLNMTSLAAATARIMARGISPGDEILVTELDHDSNVVAWQQVAEERGAKLEWVRMQISDGTLDFADLERKLTKQTKVLALPWVSNALGTIIPVARAAQMAHAVGAWVFLDAVQGLPHLPTAVTELQCDVLLGSTYKFFGPHMGVMWARNGFLEQFLPHQHSQARNAQAARWETGTQNHEGQAGLLGTWDYLAALQRELGLAEQPVQALIQRLAEHESALTKHLMQGLATLPRVQVFGPPVDQRVATVSFSAHGHRPKVLAHLLAGQDINVWAGDFHATRTMERLNVMEQGGLLRVGLAHYNTHDELDRFLHTLEAVL